MGRIRGGKRSKKKVRKEGEDKESKRRRNGVGLKTKAKIEKTD